MNSTAACNLDPSAAKNIEAWLKGNYDEETKAQIRKLLQDNPKEATDAFYTTLTFGTGGLRGIMGVGTNRMNVYTVGAATQGLANYLKLQPKTNEQLSVFIGYDSRINSKKFAEEAAKVLAANGIKVFITKEIRPTPIVSFGCRHYRCSAAIMITASHNPPEYNGYKVYWNDGGQILPPHDKGIIQEVKKIKDVDQINTLSHTESPLIEFVGEEIDAAYVEAISTIQLYPEENKAQGAELKVVYTSLHGTGITLLPPTLKRWGFSNLLCEEKQCIADGNFPTVHSPNPEEKTALKLGMELLQKSNGDILIATDPDADRVGVVVNHRGELVILNGNQIACICLEHICQALINQKRMPERAAFVKTIVTSELFAAIAKSYHKPCFDVLTGFKYIAQKIHEWELDPKEGLNYIFGGEESYGYLLGTHTRDKDAISASALICEAALRAKSQNKTLVDLLHDLYRKYGVYVEKLLSVSFPETKEGREQMALGMKRIEQETPKEIGGIAIQSIENYKLSEKTILKTGSKERITLPKSDVIAFRMEDGSKLTIRPSGTEPKIKIYCEVVVKDGTDLQESVKKGEARAELLLKALKMKLEN